MKRSFVIAAFSATIVGMFYFRDHGMLMGGIYGGLIGWFAFDDDTSYETAWMTTGACAYGFIP